MMGLRKDDMLQESAVLFILNMLASVLNYACQLFMAQVLSVESFGTVNTVFSFMLIVGVPGTTLTMIVSKYYAQLRQDCNRDEKIGFIVRIIGLVSYAALALFALCVAIMRPLSQLLSIEDMAVLFFMFALGAMGFYQPLYSGVFAGNKRFVLVGLYALAIPIYKIVSIIAAKWMFVDDVQRLYTILVVMIGGTVFTALLGHYGAVRILGKFSLIERSQYRMKLTADDINTLVLNVCLMIYMNIDLFAVRYHVGEGESGLYSSALLFGRVIYYFATTLGTILLPLVAADEAGKAQQKKLFHKTMGLLLLFMAGCIVFFNVGGGFLIRLLYGSGYAEAQQYVKYVSLISAALSICTVLVNYLVGVGRTKFATYSMAAINMLIFVMLIFVSNIKAVLTGIGVIGMAGAAVIYLVSVYMTDKEMK